MRDKRPNAGFTLWELAAVVAAITCLLAVAVPVIGRGGGDSGVQTSMSNLTTLGMAHVLYAMDWDARQVTWVVDDLGLFGSVSNYNNSNGCDPPFDTAGCHPNIDWGWGQDGYLYAYRSTSAGSAWAFSAINFSGGAQYFGRCWCNV